MILLDYLLIPCLRLRADRRGDGNAAAGSRPRHLDPVAGGSHHRRELVRDHRHLARQFRLGRPAGLILLGFLALGVIALYAGKGNGALTLKPLFDAAAFNAGKFSARRRFASCRSSVSMPFQRLPKKCRAATGGSSAARSSQYWCSRRCFSSRPPGFSGICCPASRPQGSGGGGVRTRRRDYRALDRGRLGVGLRRHRGPFERAAHASRCRARRLRDGARPAAACRFGAHPPALSHALYRDAGDRLDLAWSSRY